MGCLLMSYAEHWVNKYIGAPSPIRLTPFDLFCSNECHGECFIYKVVIGNKYHDQVEVCYKTLIDVLYRKYSFFF